MAGSRCGRILSGMVLAVSILLCSRGLCGTYGGGAGTAIRPYIISETAHLLELSTTSTDWGCCFELTASISAAGYVPVTLFTGTFDGGGYSISSFSRSTAATGDNSGFFCKVQGASACIKNLTLVSPSLNTASKRYVGAIAGSLWSGRIERCHVVGGTVKGGDYTGGIVGYNASGTVLACTSSATVNGRNYVGGLMGLNDQYSYVTRCSATGSATASDNTCGGFMGENLGYITDCQASGNAGGVTYIGGLVGANGKLAYPGSVVRSFATGQATGSTYVGGLAGRNYVGDISDSYAWGRVNVTNVPGGGLTAKNEIGATIARCYSAGYVSKLGSGYGGLVGQNAAVPSAITNSFWDTDTSGQTSSAAGEGRTTTQMYQIVTFTSYSWDFLGEWANGTSDTWRMCLDDVSYPRLSREWPPTDMACPDVVDFRDFAVLAASWQTAAAGLPGDFDLSGAVDIADLAVFVDQWLCQTAPGA